MTKKCPKCGKENEDVASFCANCGYSFNSEFNRNENSDKIEISIEENGSRRTIRLPGLKTIAVLVALLLIVGIIAFNHGGIGTDSNSNGGNITLIKEKITGYGYTYEGKSYYSYYVEGVLKNLPRDIDDYELKATFYDDEGKFIYEDEGYLPSIKESSDKSQSTLLASCYSDDLRNMSFVTLELKDSNGDLVFNKTLFYDMSRMDLSGMEED